MGDGIRRIAEAYYERANEKEKNEAKDYFEKLDLNGDGKISLAEFRSGADSWLSENDQFFNKLDSNSDGALYFADVLVLFYYHEGAISIHRCDGCRHILLDDLYFTCAQCLPLHPRTYDLCCDCYRLPKFQHAHPLSDLMQVPAAHAKSIRRTQTQSEMEQVREIVKAHYGASSAEVQNLAKELFYSMDSDGDGQVDLAEFQSFMRRQGCSIMRNPNFFNQLDKDGNGTLDFVEVMALYYIIQSRRPFCDACGEFIPGIFFSCVQCFKGNTGNSFDLCLRCYQSGDCKHNHGGRTQFSDNYTLLLATRDAALQQQTVATTTQTKAVVAANAAIKVADVALKASDVALNIANIAGCSIL